MILCFESGWASSLVVVARGIAHHHDAGRIGAEVHVELFFDRTAEARVQQILDYRVKTPAVTQIRVSPRSS